MVLPRNSYAQQNKLWSFVFLCLVGPVFENWQTSPAANGTKTVSRGLCLSPPLRLLGKHVFQACVSRGITPIATSASLHRFLLEDVLMRTLYLFACRPRRSSGCTKRLLGNPAQALKLVRGGLFFWSRAKQHGLIYYDTSDPRGSQKRIRFGTPRGPEAGPPFGPAGPRNRARGSKNAVQILDRKW